MKNKKKAEYFAQYISNNEFLDKYSHLDAAIITPDVDIVENSEKFSPAYIVFDNYELILKWNRSLSCLLYTSPSPRDVEESRMPSSA